MKKIYIGFLFLAISVLSMGQTVEIVKDYQPTSNEWGTSPNSLTSNSSMMVFSGGEAARYFFGAYTVFYEPFVTDGTATNFVACDINPGSELGMQSNPKNYFVLNDTIYFTANDAEGEKLFKINDLTGDYEAVATWTTGNNPTVISPFGGDKVVFAGKNPDDETDETIYLLEWDGEATSPSIRINGQTPLFDMNPSNLVSYLGGPRDITFLYAKDPTNASLGYQLCVTASSFFGGVNAQFFDLVTDQDDYVEDFTIIEGSVYFNDGKNLVWKTQGSQPELVADINSAVEQNTMLALLGEWQGKLIFKGKPAGATNDQRRMFMYDPALTGEEAITILAERDFRSVSDIKELDGMFYFVANERFYDTDGVTYTGSQSCLFNFDGNEIKNVSGDLVGASEPHVFNGKVYFSAVDEDGGDEGGTTHHELFSYGAPTTYYINYVTEGGTHSNLDRFNALSEDITLGDAAKEGYSTFVGWYTTADYQEGTEITVVNQAAIDNGTLVATDVDGQMTINIYAKYSDPVVYSISFDALDGTHSNTVTNYTVADEVTLEPAVPNAAGYKFYKWYTEYTAPSTFSGDSYTTSIPVNTTGDLTLYAKYLTITYNITYELDGGDKNGQYYKTSYKVTDATIVLNTPVKDGFEFVGWYTTVDFQEGTEITEITSGSTGDITVYAKWSGATAIGDVEIDGFSVSPNPSNGVVTLNGIDTQDATYYLYDMSGTQVEKGLVVANQIDFKVGAGVYLLKVENKVQVQVVKIIIR
ncbi:InlB B-repeat-containing protein [Carboxylicivirga linearis]|uniref:InlB B-repeat-containing protein n=1 Tax=Carboxylicivirga linearis TaxID=1628157 RepID=A0ABS5JZS4_9BACT|nr:InlB B-repeat-containing protein [Carboxylicivirga linearis]MBS2100398.1 InlB B-repeat-containing protein [Carboxylicivirga linearis]